VDGGGAFRETIGLMEGDALEDGTADAGAAGLGTAGGGASAALLGRQSAQPNSAARASPGMTRVQRTLTRDD